MEKGPDEKFCAHCGEIIDIRAEICPRCGVRIMAPPSFEQGRNAPDAIEAHRKWIITLLLAFMFGIFGVHRFYNRKVGTGLLMLFTWGGFGIWYIIDLIVIILGDFRDKDGNLIR